MYFLFYVHKAVENKRASEEEIGIELKYLKFFVQSRYAEMILSCENTSFAFYLYFQFLLKKIFPFRHQSTSFFLLRNVKSFFTTFLFFSFKLFLCTRRKSHLVAKERNKKENCRR